MTSSLNLHPRATVDLILERRFKGGPRRTCSQQGDSVTTAEIDGETGETEFVME